LLAVDCLLLLLEAGLLGFERLLLGGQACFQFGVALVELRLRRVHLVLPCIEFALLRL
jgi:hypothetical protein